VVLILRAVVLLATLVLTSVLGSGVAAAAAAVPAASAARVPCEAGARACVRLSTNQAWLVRAGRVVTGPVPISSGRPGFRTPAGTFRVSYRDKDHLSSLFGDAPMPYSVFFNGGIAFHQGSVRVPSHGCIHLPAAAARAFFGELRPGDVVQVVR
jgi:lipoprotein-anchoring transpeptidase ErfK/SrfK